VYSYTQHVNFHRFMYHMAINPVKFVQSRMELLY